MVQQTHAHHAHGEDRRAQRRAEERREEGRHAGHRRGAQVAVVELHHASDAIADAAAHLQRGALASGRAADEMRQHRREEDRRDQRAGDALARLDLAEDVVGALPLDAQDAVDRDGQQTGGRERVEDPAVALAQLGRELDADVEGRAEQAAEHAHERGDHQPLPQRLYIEQQMLQIAFDVLQNSFHILTSYGFKPRIL